MGDRVDGATCGSISGAGAAAIGQVVKLEWSPGALGCNSRQILTAMTTHGHILAFGEHIDSSAAQGIRARTFKTWKMLWSIGSGMPLPVRGASSKELRITDERVVSFSWAGEIAPARALLAYRNQAEDVVIMAVQYITRGQKTGWVVEEVGRFAANGPHSFLSPFDPDYVPRGSMFSLKWSSWVKTSNTSRTATLAYISHNHVGFRRVTLLQDWELDQTPPIQVEERDTTGICLTLFSDAFVDWENITWSEDNGTHARGVIATPMTVKPFQVSLTESPASPVTIHSTSDCTTTYANDTDSSTNPIVGLIVHPSDPNNKPPVPRYTLVRMSATASNQDWFQTTLPEEQFPLPQWAEDIGQRVSRTIPRVMALKGVSRDSDDEESEDEEMGGVEDGTIYVHPHRFRFWAIAASPGGGSTAVLYSRHSTLHSDKKPAAQVFFGWYVADEEGSGQKISTDGLTTEGRVWEWMYGNGEDVPGMAFIRDSAAVVRDTPLKEKFDKVMGKFRCVFCEGELQRQGKDVICSNGHSFCKLPSAPSERNANQPSKLLVSHQGCQLWHQAYHEYVQYADLDV